MRIKVVEVFDSMQGEGYWMGIYCTFIRLPGCNYACPFCDTNFSKASTELDTCAYKFQRHVIITGGEPTIHPLINELIDALHEHGCFVHVETNGSHIADLNADWITCSPKPMDFCNNPGFTGDWYNNITKVNEIKQVVSEDWIEDNWITMAILNRLIIWLQPCDGPYINESKERIARLINKYPEIFRAGIQLHKYYEVQ